MLAAKVIPIKKSKGIGCSYSATSGDIIVENFAIMLHMPNAFPMCSVGKSFILERYTALNPAETPNLEPRMKKGIK